MISLIRDSIAEVKMRPRYRFGLAGTKRYQCSCSSIYVIVAQQHAFDNGIVGLGNYFAVVEGVLPCVVFLAEVYIFCMVIVMMGLSPAVRL